MTEYLFVACYVIGMSLQYNAVTVILSVAKLQWGSVIYLRSIFKHISMCIEEVTFFSRNRKFEPELFVEKC